MKRLSDLLQPVSAVVAWLQQILPLPLRQLQALPLANPELAKSGARVRLILPPEAVLRTSFDAPAAPLTESRLAALIAARCDEISPWDSGEYLCANQLSERTLVLALTPVKPIRAFEEVLAARGCDLAEVVSLEGGRVAFWFRQDAVQRQSWRSRLTVGLAAVVVLGLSATALGVSLTLAAQDRLATAEAALARQTARHAALTGMGQATMALLSRKRPDQSLGIMLDHLAEHLPDDSWLEALNITPAGFELSGRSANPEAIIPALEADKSFAAVDFAGSSARDAQSGAFTFAVQGKIAAANGAGP